MTGSTPTTPQGRGDERTNQQPTVEQDEGASATHGRHGSGRGRNLYWLLPALAFVAGLLLGGGVIAAADLGSDDAPAAQAGDGTETSPAPAGDRTITVPADCVDGLDKAEAAVEAARNGIDAIGRLDTAELQRALDRLQTLQPEITDLAGKCRTAATDGN